MRLFEKEALEGPTKIYESKPAPVVKSVKSFRTWMKKSEDYKRKVTESLLSCSKVCNGYKWWRKE